MATIVYNVVYIVLLSWGNEEAKSRSKRWHSELALQSTVTIIATFHSVVQSHWDALELAARHPVSKLDEKIQYLLDNFTGGGSVTYASCPRLSRLT
jgi:hypothetical protein